jgi:hypothetical protein
LPAGFGFCLFASFGFVSNFGFRISSLAKDCSGLLACA